MLDLRKVAITGGIASGKSTALGILKELGAYVVDADKIVHLLLEKDTDTINAIIKELGEDVIVNGHLDRRRIADKVFNQKTNKLKTIENILHPKVFTEIQKHYNRALQEGGYLFFAVEMPLLFETHSENWYDFTVAIFTNPALCRQRIKNDDLRQYDVRVSLQFTPEEKAARAHFVIHNNQDKNKLREELKKIVQLISL